MSEEPEQVIQEVPPEPEQAPRPHQRIFTRQEKIRYFSFGFLGWWLVNILVWALFGGGYGMIGLITFPANIIALLLLAFSQRWVALGMLAAIAANLLISLMLGMGLNALCFIPFLVN